MKFGESRLLKEMNNESRDSLPKPGLNWKVVIHFDKT